MKTFRRGQRVYIASVDVCAATAATVVSIAADRSTVSVERSDNGRIVAYTSEEYSDVLLTGEENYRREQWRLGLARLHSASERRLRRALAELSETALRHAEGHRYDSKRKGAETGAHPWDWRQHEDTLTAIALRVEGLTTSIREAAK